MKEVKAIKYSTLHLERGPHEWLYHGLATLGHANITSYMDFTQRLLDKFDSKYRELHIRQIAQIKQTDMVDSYIIEFHRLEVMVSDVSEQWLIMLFAEGLSEPLHGWVKAFKPITQ